MSCWNRLGSVGLLEAAAGNGTLSYRRNIWKDKLSERVPMNCILIRHESWKQCWFVGLCSNILRVRLRCAWCIRAQVVIPCRSRGLGLRRSSTILEADTGSSGTLAHCMQDHPTTHPQRLREGRQGPAVAAVAATARCATGFMLKAPQCPGDGSWTLSPWDPAMSHRVPR